MDWVDELRPEKCLFRGLPNKDHSTEASAWRRLTNEQDSNNIDKLLEINEGLIRDARLRGFDSKDDRKLSDLEILAELQHLRASTFLIDFTYSAQVALWFACQQRFKDPHNSKELSDGKVCAVFVNPDRIQEVTPELLKQDISVFLKQMPTGHTHSIGGNQVNSTVVFHRSTLSSCLVLPELLNLMRNALSLKLTSDRLWILSKVSHRPPRQHCFLILMVSFNNVLKTDPTFPKAMRVTGQLVIEHIDGKIMRRLFLTLMRLFL